MPSTIEWTDETWNPVTGCTQVSPGCDNCYMFALYPRLTAMGVHGYEGDPRQVRLLPERLDAPLHWGKSRRVFVNSMSDVFHPRVPYDFVTSIFDVMCTAAAQPWARIPGLDQATRPSRRVVGTQPEPLWGRVAGWRMDRHVS